MAYLFFAMRGGDAALSNLLWDFLLSVHMLVCQSMLVGVLMGSYSVLLLTNFWRSVRSLCAFYCVFDCGSLVWFLICCNCC